jgi:tetratricopeptide (TPR) repeat protein
MRFPTSILAGLTLALGLAAPLSAQQAPDQIETLSGAVFRGTILSNDGARVEIETTEGAIKKLRYALLTPSTQYRLRRAIMGEDGRSHLELAEWCVEMALYTEAKRHFRLALQVDPTMEEEIEASLVEARTTAANELLERAKGLASSNQPNGARRILTTLVTELPEEEAATEAMQLLAADTDRRKQSALARLPVPEPLEGGSVRSSGEAFSANALNIFAPVIDAYRKMLDNNQRGLLETGTSAIRAFERALRDGETAFDANEKIRPQGAGDEEIAEALAVVDAKIEEGLVEARVNLADVYLLRNNFGKASEVVSEGMVRFPRNEQLRQARNRATAAASGGGFGWGGIGRPTVRGR